jgi:hypothetical protein
MAQWAVDILSFELALNDLHSFCSQRLDVLLMPSFLLRIPVGKCGEIVNTSNLIPWKAKTSCKFIIIQPFVLVIRPILLKRVVEVETINIESHSAHRENPHKVKNPGSRGAWGPQETRSYGGDTTRITNFIDFVNFARKADMCMAVLILLAVGQSIDAVRAPAEEGRVNFVLTLALHADTFIIRISRSRR